MKSHKRVRSILGSVTVGFFLLLALSARTEEIHFSSGIYEASQVQMGEAIKNAAFYRWNMGRIQQEAGAFIQKESLRGEIPQEGLGSWIAAAGHLRWQLFQAQEALGASIIRVAQAATGRVQEELGAVIASNAQQKMAEASAEAQVAMGQAIQGQAQIQWASGMMAGALHDLLQGKTPSPVAPETLQVLRRTSGGFEAEQNFRLALGLLEQQTGQALTAQVLPSNQSLAALGFSSLRPESGGLGGFAEFGIWSLLGFLFVGWVALREYSSTLPPYPRAEEEPVWIYKEAA